MKKIFSLIRKIRNYYQYKGLLGISIKRLIKIRGGDDFLKVQNVEVVDTNKPSKSKTSQALEQIDEILNDDRITNEQKNPFRNIREEICENSNSEKIKMKRLRDSLIAKLNYPVYSKIKGKIPYAILSPFTFSELARLANYRVAGLTSAPFTISSLLGILMPYAVTFSMLKMYVPDRLKFPCKCAKWSGGIVFYGVSNAVDHITAPIEKKKSGQALPIDAPQLMGTLPERNDVKEFWKKRKLADSMSVLCTSLDTLLNQVQNLSRIQIY